MSYTRFVRDRLNELQSDPSTDGLVAAMEAALEIEELWPVLITTEPSFKTAPSDEFDGRLNSFTMSVTQRFEWVIAKDYLEKFGLEAPSTPMVRAFLSKYQTHPDFQKGWL